MVERGLDHLSGYFCKNGAPMVREILCGRFHETRVDNELTGSDWGRLKALYGPEPQSEVNSSSS